MNINSLSCLADETIDSFTSGTLQRTKGSYLLRATSNFGYPYCRINGGVSYWPTPSTTASTTPTISRFHDYTVPIRLYTSPQKHSTTPLQTTPNYT